MNRTLLIAAGFLSATACGLGDEDKSTDTEPTASDTDTGVAVHYPDCTKADGDDYWLFGLGVSGDTLSAEVSYSGGCEDHEFTLCWPDPAFAESYPVQVWLELHHEGNGDDCEAEVDETVTFDLTPLKNAYLDAYGGSTGDITIHVDGESVDYSF